MPKSPLKTPESTADNSVVWEICPGFPRRMRGLAQFLQVYLPETNIFFSFLKVLWHLLAERAQGLSEAARRRPRRRDFFVRRESETGVTMEAPHSRFSITPIRGKLTFHVTSTRGA